MYRLTAVGRPGHCQKCQNCQKIQIEENKAKKVARVYYFAIVSLAEFVPY
jgi:hypothetical protein